MKSEELKNRLISYLYDEMSTEERLDFETEIEKDPSLKKELDEFRKLRKGLARLEDKEVMEPFFLWGRNGSFGWNRIFKRRSLIMFRPYIAVAASIMLIFVVGYLTRFSISYENDNLYIGFNAREIRTGEDNDGLTEKEIINLVKNEIARNNSVIMARLDETEDSFNGKLASLESTQKKRPVVRQAANTVTEDELQQYFEQLQTVNAEIMKDFLQTATVQQQEYFQAVLTQFSDYLQEQREEDMRLIRRNMINLKEDQDQQQLETQQMLANLLNNADNQNN